MILWDRAMKTTFCLDCEKEVELGSNPTIGSRVICPRCGVVMEIINVEPLELDWVFDGPVTRSPLFDNWWPLEKAGHLPKDI
jgi:lysine biosynthesis protein LysW